MNEVSASRVVCRKCGRTLKDNEDELEFLGVDRKETGFEYLCECGAKFLIKFD